MTVGGPVVPGTEEDPLLGRVLSERYRILRKLGEGGMGVVYLAEHIVIEKKIALKVLFPDLTRRADLVQRFIQEAKSASRIGHENVIDITDFGQSPEGYVFIAMEYLSGQDLGQVLKASGPMPWKRAQPIVLQIAKALRAAHERGIIHRDMKPENIFVIPRDDGREFIKVLDFGIAKVMGLDEDAPRLTRTGMIFGTPEYMSPEQAQGQSVDHRVDIYAVGCIMYQILTGQVPFQAESFMGILSKHMMEAPEPPRHRNPSVDPAIETIVLKAMEKDPARRYQSMGELVVALTPSGSGADLSGAISLAAGMSAPRTVVPASLSQPAPAPAKPVANTGAVTASAPTKGRAAVAPSVLPHATHEIPGRAGMPLAAANPEVRRSRTELFERSGSEALLDRPPVRAKRGGNLVLLGAVAALVAIGATALFLRQRAGAPAPSVAGGAASPTRAMEPKPDPAPVPKAESKAPASPVTASIVVTPSVPADDAKGDGKRAGGHRHRRSAREAVDSLHLPPAAEETARPPSGVSTPAELKNPFVPAP